MKIDPQHIGVGLYQHDMRTRNLKESLGGVVESCVNFVGVDLNTASVPLLRHVSGLNQLVARDNGPGMNAQVTWFSPSTRAYRIRVINFRHTQGILSRCNYALNVY